MKLTYVMLGTLGAFFLSIPAAAQLPTPLQAAGPQQAQAYLFFGGAGDVFETTTSTMAQRRASNPEVKAFATMLIADHTNLTNNALAAAAGASVTAPPPELSDAQKQMIAQLAAAGPNFDQVFLDQQLAAHQETLQLQRGYASNGDVPALRRAAASAVPIVQSHIAEIGRLARR